MARIHPWLAMASAAVLIVSDLVATASVEVSAGFTVRLKVPVAVAVALSVIVTTRVPLASGNPPMLLSVRVNEAVPTDEPPGRTLPAETTEVDASAGTAPATVPSPASRVAARPKLTARLVGFFKAGGLQLTGQGDHRQGGLSRNNG